MNEVRQHCIDLNGLDLLSLIAEYKRRSSEQSGMNARCQRLPFRLAYVSSYKLHIDEYHNREDSWTETDAFDIQIENFAMIHRDGKLILIGGRDAECQATNMVISSIRF